MMTLATCVAVLGAIGAASAATTEPSPYAPYEFLVGEWDVGPAQGEPFGVARVRWGPGHSYLWYSVSTFESGAEQPHMEGMLMWNAVHKNLDMLMALDLNGGRVQEQGTVDIRPDGTVVRDITSYFSVNGKEGSGRFRQTFKAAGRDTVITAVMRQTKDGWVPSFPGSDRFVMSRRGNQN